MELLHYFTRQFPSRNSLKYRGFIGLEFGKTLMAIYGPPVPNFGDAFNFGSNLVGLADRSSGILETYLSFVLFIQKNHILILGRSVNRTPGFVYRQVYSGVFGCIYIN
jgi:hypothetical protein